jgi:hypothetical protein
MDAIKDAEDVLKTIETAVVALSKKNPAMTNYTALRAYEGAIEHYRLVAREQDPKPANASGLDGAALEAVLKACHLRIGKPISEKPDSPRLSAEALVSCLRRLKKSVEFWTNKGGRRGYLDFIAGFIN